MAGKLRWSSDPGRDGTGRKGKGRINAREYTPYSQMADTREKTGA